MREGFRCRRSTNRRRPPRPATDGASLRGKLTIEVVGLPPASLYKRRKVASWNQPIFVCLAEDFSGVGAYIEFVQHMCA